MSNKPNCGNCGAPVTADITFCRQCGQLLAGKQNPKARAPLIIAAVLMLPLTFSSWMIPLGVLLGVPLLILGIGLVIAVQMIPGIVRGLTIASIAITSLYATLLGTIVTAALVNSGSFTNSSMRGRRGLDEVTPALVLLGVVLIDIVLLVRSLRLSKRHQKGSDTSSA